MPSYIKALKVILISAVVLLLGGCESDLEQSNKGQSDASSYIIASNQRMAESLDFTDQQDFADAQRRLVARAPDNDDFTIVLP
jgi:alkyl sulfatase BDS1-like metallo-beta-lactamase superfamily hydrolase|tara:strand:+ start:792 stop:1040 length:249 start_codon:yes stop_codon:yes gene_type:complete